jgi:hypothetical protein
MQHIYVAQREVDRLNFYCCFYSFSFVVVVRARKKKRRTSNILCLLLYDFSFSVVVVMTILTCSGVTRIFFSYVLPFILWVISHETQRRTQEKNILDTSLHSPTRWRTNIRAKKVSSSFCFLKHCLDTMTVEFADNLFLFCLK